MFVLKHFTNPDSGSSAGVPEYTARAVKVFNVSSHTLCDGFTIHYEDLSSGQIGEFPVFNGQEVMVENCNGKTIDRIRARGPANTAMNCPVETRPA